MTAPTRRRSRLRYSDFAYYFWFLLAALCVVAALWTALFGEWGWTLGFTVAALSVSAHARLERLDGHTHRGHVEVP